MQKGVGESGKLERSEPGSCIQSWIRVEGRHCHPSPLCRRKIDECVPCSSPLSSVFNHPGIEDICRESTMYLGNYLLKSLSRFTMRLGALQDDLTSLTLFQIAWE